MWTRRVRQGQHVSCPRPEPRHSSTVLSETSSVLSISGPETEHEEAHTAWTWLRSPVQGTSTRVGQGLVSPQLQGRGPQTCCAPRGHHARSGWVGHAVCIGRGARVPGGAGFIPHVVHPPRVIKLLKILTAQPDRRCKHSCVLCGKSGLRKRNWALKGQAEVRQSLPPCSLPWACSTGRQHLVIVAALSSMLVRSLAPVTSRSPLPVLYGRSSFPNLESSPF